MRNNYKLSQQLVGSIVLISLCLQSCSHSFNPSIPRIQESTDHKQPIPIQVAIDPLLSQPLTSQGGHLVTFYEQAGQLQAEVVMNAPAGFSKTYTDLPVQIAPDIDLTQLPYLNKEAQKRIIHFNAPKNGQPRSVSLIRNGLLGGMKKGGKEVEEEGEKRADIYQIITHTNQEKEEEKARDAAAQNDLGVMYATGRGVAPSDEQAVAWFKQAANQGYAAAQCNLGWMYATGRGVAPSDEQAIEWFRQAANQGLADAQNTLGLMYVYGRGVAPSDKQAVAWFQQAANQGLTKAQSNLGLMYATGRGVAPSDEQTKMGWI